MTEQENYWQHDEAIGEARFWRENYIVPLKVHKSAEAYCGRKDRQRESKIAGALTARATQYSGSDTDFMPAAGIVHFNAYAHLVSIDPSKNRYRFYTLTWRLLSSRACPGSLLGKDRDLGAN